MRLLPDTSILFVPEVFKALRKTYNMIDNNNQLMEMYGPAPDGKEYKMMSIKYTRK